LRYHPILRSTLGGLTAAALSVAGLAVPASAADSTAMVAGGQQEITAALGDTFQTTLSVTNTGTSAIDGAAITFATNWGFEDVAQFANCEYDAGQMRACVFDQTLEPGKSYRLVVPYKVRADTYAPGGIYGQFGWQPAAEHTTAGAPGTGATLRLQEGDRIGTGNNGGWQAVDVTVTGKNGSDLVALGTGLVGGVGAVVNAEVGVRNAGPATLDGTMSGTSLGDVRVTIPAGTSVVTVPSGCDLAADDEPAQPGAVQYMCSTAKLFKAGATKTWTFPLKINKAVAGAAGSVEVNPDCQCQRFLDDLDKSNNTAPLTLTASGQVADTTAPVIESTGLVAGQPYRALIDFRPVVTDNVGVTKLVATVSTPGADAAWGSCVDGSKLSPGLWLCRANMTVQTDKEYVSDITLQAFDAAGNSSAPTTVRIPVDSNWPRFSLSPRIGAYLPPGPVTVTLGNVPDDLASVKVLDGNNGPVLATLTSAPWTYTWNAAVGGRTPCFAAFDKVGNGWGDCTDYQVDGAAPVIEQVLFAGRYSTHRLDTGAGWVGARSTLLATVADQSPITRTEWWVNGVLTSSSEIFTWDARAITTSTATVELRVWDATGNTASKSFAVRIDKAAPAATISPANNALIRGATYITSLKVSDPNGVGFSGVIGPVVIAGSRTSAKLTSGKDGVKTITWSYSDKLGNSAVAKRTVIVDNTAPAVAFKNAPANKTKLRKTISLKATASDRNGIAKVQLLVNGKVVATDTRSAYAFTLNPKKYGKTFIVQLRAYDKAGNLKVTTKRTYRR
jgi:hypothetical protein